MSGAKRYWLTPATLMGELQLEFAFDFEMNAVMYRPIPFPADPSSIERHLTSPRLRTCAPALSSM